MRIVAMVFCALTILAGKPVSADSSLFAPYHPLEYPDLASVKGDVRYVAADRKLTMDLSAEKITFSDAPNDNEVITHFGSMDPNSSGGFSLVAVIPATPDLAGATITGTLEITGVTDTYVSGTLLTGSLFAFRAIGPPFDNDQMEFLFRVTGGDLFMLYGGLNAIGYITMSATGFPGDNGFDNDFDNLVGGDDNTGTALADTFIAAVPEPGSFLLVVFGVVGLAVGVRLRSRRAVRVGSNKVGVASGN